LKTNLSLKRKNFDWTGQIVAMLQARHVEKQHHERTILLLLAVTLPPNVGFAETGDASAV
jgi:hypothetical protein